MAFHDAVDEAELHGLLGRQELVALHGLFDAGERLAAVVGVDLVEPAARREDLAGVDFDVRRIGAEMADGEVAVAERIGAICRLRDDVGVIERQPGDVIWDLICTGIRDLDDSKHSSEAHKRNLGSE